MELAMQNNGITYIIPFSTVFLLGKGQNVT